MVGVREMCGCMRAISVGVGVHGAWQAEATRVGVGMSDGVREICRRVRLLTVYMGMPWAWQAEATWSWGA